MRFIPHWRKSTWALLIWTVLIGVWLVNAGGITGTAMNDCTGQYVDACQAGSAIGGGIAMTMIFGIWFVGFIVLTLVWFMSRPKDNVVVYGPDGQQVTVSEKEAKKRVNRGWSYNPQ